MVSHSSISHVGYVSDAVLLQLRLDLKWVTALFLLKLHVMSNMICAKIQRTEMVYFTLKEHIALKSPFRNGPFVPSLSTTCPWPVVCEMFG